MTFIYMDMDWLNFYTLHIFIQESENKRFSNIYPRIGANDQGNNIRFHFSQIQIVMKPAFKIQ